MPEKITKGEITYLAKELCKFNDQLLYVAMRAEELATNEVLRRIMREKDNEALSELRKKVLKYGDYEELGGLVTVTDCEWGIEEVKEILHTIVYYE